MEDAGLSAVQAGATIDDKAPAPEASVQAADGSRDGVDRMQEGVAREKKEKKDKHGGGEGGGHKKDKKDREGGGVEGERREKKERVDHRGMLCEGCRAALKLEEDEQLEDLDATSKTVPALHHTVAAGHVACLRALLKVGNQAEGVNEAYKGKTPLHIAVLKCDVDCTSCLLDAGADGAPAWQGMPALHLALAMRCCAATRDSSLSIINLMLKSPSFDPNLRDASSSPPLSTAAAAADSEAVSALLIAGADPTYSDAHGCSPLHLALMSENPAVIALLQTHNNAHHQNSDGATCDHLIAALPPIFGGCQLRSDAWAANASALHDAAGMAVADVAAASSALSASSSNLEGPCFLFCDSAVTRQHVAEVAFCTEAAARVDVLAGDSGVLLDAAARTSATIISHMPLASLPDLARCHSWSYLARIRDLSLSCSPSNPYISLDADTMLSAATWEAARRSAGGACAAVDAVLGRGGSYSQALPSHATDVKLSAPPTALSSSSPPALLQQPAAASSSRGRAFVVARPPGHHCGYAYAHAFFSHTCSASHAACIRTQTHTHTYTHSHTRTHSPPPQLQRGPQPGRQRLLPREQRCSCSCVRHGGAQGCGAQGGDCRYRRASRQWNGRHREKSFPAQNFVGHAHAVWSAARDSRRVRPTMLHAPQNV